MRVFHCSRLVEEEISDVLRTGLRPLAAHHLEQRILRLKTLGLISEQISDSLCERHWAKQSGREGLIAFITDKKELSNPDEVGWLLNFWGGEALTMNRTDDPITGPVLWSLGVACIFELERTARSSDPAHRTSFAVPSSEIVAVHRYGSRSFEDLTKCNEWERFSLDRPSPELVRSAWEERFSEN